MFIDEINLIREIKSEINVKKNLEYLISVHDGIFYKVLYGYLSSDVHGLTKQDIINQKLTIFWEAVNTFDEERGTKFVTWLGNFTFFFVSKEYNKLKHSKNSVEIIDNLLISHHEIASKLDTLDYMLKKLDDIEDDRIIKIFRLRYFETSNHKLKTWKEIGEQLDLTGQACLNLHNKGIDYLKNKIKYEQQDFIQCTN